MTTDKEKCFEDAADAFQNATGQDLGLEHQQPWRLLQDGTWERGSSWWSTVNSYLSGNAAQIRRPDLTINGDTVVDLKFTRNDGTVDDWSRRPGQGNGELQRDDYNDINRQHNPDFDNDDPKLDPETCQCDARGANPVGVEVPALDPFGMPQTGGIGIPRGAPGTSGAPVRVPGGSGIPIRIPSSERYKTDIAEADLRAERLLELDVKSFNWAHDGAPEVGLIAEEVQAQVPELYYKDGSFSGIKAAQLPFYLLELIKTQQAQIAALTDQVAALQKDQDDDT